MTGNPTHRQAPRQRAAAAPRRRLPRLRAEHALVASVTAIVAYLALVPIGYLLWSTFVVDGSPSLANLRDAYGAVGLGEMALNSVWFALGSTAVAAAAGMTLAYLAVRTNLPGRRAVVVLSLAQLLIPGVLYTISWILLASPRTGILNRALEPAVGPGAIEIFGLGGMIFVEGLHLVPVVFLIMAAAFSLVDPALEEAAGASGARLPSVLRRVTLPLARPALSAAVLVAAVRALQAFEVPALLGIPGGTWVFTSRIWHALDGYPGEFGQAGAYALPLLLLSAAGVLLLSRVSVRPRRFQAVTGKGPRQPHRIDLRRWRWPFATLVFAYLTVAVVLPLLVMLYASTQPFYSAPTLHSLSRTSFDTYAAVLGRDETVRSFFNTAVLAAGTATIVMLFGAVAGWLVVRTRLRGRWLIDGLAFVSIAIPSLVLGAALLVLYVRLPLPIYGTLWIMLIAYVTGELAYGIRFASAPLHQIGSELEESAQVSGATWWPTFRRVLLPLLAPGLAAGWIYAFVASSRELSSSILLYSPGNEVISIRLWELYQQGHLSELAALGLVTFVILAGLIAVAYRIGGTLGIGRS